ncbi:hypothetical protein NA56DRAFT_641645 [Hyaloscypha hepaticicola]|uniref:Uncharacterized protein n=1 Tax=Hyaloscypha hepaticicola TaxID=2082293 RepID=A0A2J6QIM2_9HELO|nr:hypothetical protein NA56DRAFT_641645 [Hyaloscypha hepaticicola]
MGTTFNPLIYQSRLISLSEWLQMLTILLAPLIMHIVGGIPDSVIFSKRKPPSVLSRFPHFNPVSIVWRYYAIADRRSRARRWDEYDMAASNAAIKLPESSHIKFMSGSFLTSVAVTIQGVQGLDYIIQHAPGNAFPTIFYPLTVMGLLRLQAAFWLSNDYGFHPDADWILKAHDAAAGDRPEREQADMQRAEVRERLISPISWRGVLFRVWWLASVLGLFVLSAYTCISELLWKVGYCSVSALSQLLFYTLFTFSMLLIHGFYVLSDRTNTTLIPCINSSWYKAYSVLICLAALACVIIAAIETRVRFEGRENPWDGYTTYDTTIVPDVCSR